MDHDIFISYSSLQKEKAIQICDYLEEHEIVCWMAPRDIPAGSDYGDEIGDAIHNAKAVVLVFSESASLSSWVKGEINTAFDERKMIMPFRIDSTDLKGGLKVMLNQFHWIDSTTNFSEALKELVVNIEKLIGKKEHRGPLIEVTTEAGQLMKVFKDLSLKTEEGLSFFAARNFTNLKIHGEMNARDFYFLKSFCTMLEYLDFSDVKIKAYNGPYGTMHDYHSMDEIRNVAYEDNEIPAGAFFYWIPKDEGMPSLLEITLPDGITRIRRNAFARAYNLRKINIPEGVTKLDWVCFCCCFSLKHIEIPSTVIELEDQVFSGTPLTEVHVKNPIPAKIGFEPFGPEKESKRITLYVPKGTSENYKISEWSKYIENIVEE